MALTATFKHTKVALRNEGADPARVKGEDKLFFLDGKQGYVPLDVDRWAKIATGKAKL